MVNSKQYLDLVEIVAESASQINFKTLKKLHSILSEFYYNLSLLENQSFPSSFALNAFLHEKYKFPKNLKDLFNKFNFLIKPRNIYKIKDIEAAVNACKQLVELIINYISTNEIDNDKFSNVLTYFESFTTYNKELTSLYNLICTKKISQNDIGTIYNFVDEFENVVQIKFKEPWNDINNYLRINNRINIIDLNLVSERKYETTGRTLVIIEPDYLVDVTELSGSFYKTGIDYLINLISKLKEPENNFHLLLGKIVNFTFDKLIEEENADFESTLGQSLRIEPLGFFALFKKNANIYDELKANLELHFSNLKVFLSKDKFSQPVIEPSFISPTYGLQGRLDLADIKSDDFSEVNIIEMKSGKAPSLNMTVRGDNHYRIAIGAWEQHIAQVTGYNLLLDELNNSRFGTSAILYSKDTKDTLRNVPNVFLYKQQLLKHRNYIVALEFTIANRRFKIFENDKVELPGINFISKDILEFFGHYKKADEITREWFKEQLSFAYREIFSLKIGYFASNNSKPYSNLWNLNKFDNIHNSHIIKDLKLNIEKSDPDKLHMEFDAKCEQMQFTSIREGDIVVLFAYDSYGECLPHKDQVLRGSVIEATNTSIRLSLRNKSFKRDKFNVATDWAIISDRIESSNRAVLASIFRLLKSNKKFRELFLGIRRPEFGASDVKPKQYLNDKQNEIFRKCVQAKDYFIIQGPPGTGKTTYMLKALVEQFSHEEQRKVLIIAYTNRAVDEIEDVVAGISPKINYLRVGSKAARRNSKRLVADLAERLSLRDLYKEVGKARLIISTVATAVSNKEIFSLFDFDTAIVDEASQIPEYQLSGILSYVKKFILIGDERQLPAIFSQDSMYSLIDNDILKAISMSDLTISLFERLIRQAKINGWHDCYDTLIYQARMHEDIELFPNRYFYNNKLKIFGLHQKEKIKNFSPDSQNRLEQVLSQKRMIFVDCKYDIGFKQSITEAQIVRAFCYAIKNTLANSFDSTTVGVIAPFRSQCSLVKSYLLEDKLDLILVDTVERFQGSQRQFIIMTIAVNYPQLLHSLCNPSKFEGKEIDRKLNVAITRAQSHFVITGNSEVLCKSEIYSSLIEHIKSRGIFLDSDELIC